MTELITLEGIAQQKGKKVTGYKFPDNLDDLKFPFKLLFHPNSGDGLNDNKNAKIYVKLVKNDRGFNLQSVEGSFLNLSPYSFDKSKVVISPEKVSLDSTQNQMESVPKAPTTNTKSNTTLAQDLNNSNLGKMARKIQIGVTVVSLGIFGFIAYKYWKKSPIWKIVISVFGAYNIYNIYKVFSKPAITISENPTTQTEKIGNTQVSDRQKKIETIVSKLSDPNQPGLDEFNRNFLTNLSDSELDTWLKLSDALKDDSVQKEMMKGEVAGFNYLKQKYNISETEAKNAMKKYGDELMKKFGDELIKTVK